SPLRNRQKNTPSIQTEITPPPWTLPKAAGIPRARSIDNLADLEAQMPEIAMGDGPHFVALRVEPETSFLGTPPMTYEGPEMKYRFGRALECKLGIEIFGPQGY
ncbi:MAG: hypothetical protein K2X62_10205, partial [Beijerinckiaceae bacterium]|nr:hypothetical protein [Beijerinckiaceae bacterium]